MIDQFNRRDLYCHINIFTPLYFSLHALIYHRRMFIKYVTSVIFHAVRSIKEWARWKNALFFLYEGTGEGNVSPNFLF